LLLNERQEKVKAERSEHRLALTFSPSANYHDPIMGTGEGFLASFREWPPVGEMDGLFDFKGPASGEPKGALNQAEAPEL
jgi:hypothetical protein